MKALPTIGLTAFLTVVLASTALAAQAPVGLGTAGGFAVLAGETITNTGPTTITGDVGLHPGNAVTVHDRDVARSQHVADAVTLRRRTT
jgi:type VI secretion system secreted protein VgrG